MVKFIDEAKIYVKSGNGGNGCVSFRREKYVPKGGPNGGDGGKGGDIIIIAKRNMTSLLDHRYKQHYRAKRGEHGRGKDQHGKNAPDLFVPVPVGTIIKEYNSERIFGDLVHDGETHTVCKGGRGGRGNARFVTSTNRGPRHAETGSPGEEKILKLELKLIADVGIIGFPNAGKSTLISRISSARPRISDYPFTTLTPNLGVVRYDEDKTFVVADVPGLITGAHRGAGLGLQFLRHIERTKVLIHLIDLSPITKRDPIDDYHVINEELELHSPELIKKPKVVALNKIDITEARNRLKRVKNSLSKLNVRVFSVSTITGEGVDELIAEVTKVLRSF